MQMNAFTHFQLSLAVLQKDHSQSLYLFGFVKILVWLHYGFLDLLAGSVFVLCVLFLGNW